MREADIGFSFCYEAQRQVPAILDLLATGAISLGELITDEIPLDAVVSQGLEELRVNRDAHVKNSDRPIGIARPVSRRRLSRRPPTKGVKCPRIWRVCSTV